MQNDFQSSGQSNYGFDGSKMQFQQQLKSIGDQIEAIAKQMKEQGYGPKSDELHRLGDTVEHFCDQWDGLEDASPAEKSQSTIPPNQISG